MLEYSDANAKIKKLYSVPELQEWFTNDRKVYSMDLLSGWSCPHAKECLSKVHETGEISKAGNPRVKLKDGKYTEFRCFSASQEALLPNVYSKRKRNYDALRGMGVNEMIHHLNNDLPTDAGIIRIHVAGDFFNADYMRAWYNVASMNPSILFYGYTKSLAYWQFHINEYPELDNLVLTASYGGTQDELISEYNLRSTKVVFSEFEAYKLGLEIDSDDSHAARPDLRNQDFALLIHGVQPKGSEAAKALVELKGKGSYRREKNAVR
jgi:hypothetical protein|tara:strand:+ start:177 stop:974 length:798 start_codon:yes stop_codon:yes gene_type:complete